MLVSYFLYNSLIVSQLAVVAIFSGILLSHILIVCDWLWLAPQMLDIKAKIKLISAHLRNQSIGLFICENVDKKCE